MLYTIPDYYKEFSCIAADCEDTCCAGWQIVIDEKSSGGTQRQQQGLIILKRISPASCADVSTGARASSVRIRKSAVHF